MMEELKLIGVEHDRWYEQRIEHYVSKDLTVYTLQTRGNYIPATWFQIRYPRERLLMRGNDRRAISKSRFELHETHAMSWIKRKKDDAVDVIAKGLPDHIPRDMINIIADYVTASEPVPFPSPADDAYMCIAHEIDLTTMYTIDMTRDRLAVIMTQGGNDEGEIWRIADRPEITYEISSELGWVARDSHINSLERVSAIASMMLTTRRKQILRKLWDDGDNII